MGNAAEVRAGIVGIGAMGMGVAKALLGKGFAVAVRDIVPQREPRHLFWVVKNGINMTGMPSFGKIGVPDQEIWTIVAFLKKLPNVSEADYKTWTAK